MKYAVLTFGCRVNQADSLDVEASLRRAGAVASTPEQADLVLVNTCSVTASSDQGARQAIRRLARENPSARIVVTGCYATREPQEVATLPGVVQVVPNEDKPRLIQLLPRDLELTTAERFGDGDGSCGDSMEPGVAGRTAFTLRVQTGCAEACSYCIIPETRGAPRSVPLPQLRARLESVLDAGYQEVAITGVHLGSWGRDLDLRLSLAHLLEALAQIAARRGDTVLFRISSLEPMDCSTDVVELMAAAGCFAPHFHLPLQHASDAVLERMGRPYSLHDYAALVSGIRERLPHASIGSDVIVGFPQETGEEFARLERYLDVSPLTHLHVFPYSDRPGTAASRMAGKVAGTVVRERGALIRAVGRRLFDRFQSSQIGSRHRALTLDDGTTAVTGNYLKVRIPPGRSRNAWVTVTIGGHPGALTGEVQEWDGSTSLPNASTASC